MSARSKLATMVANVIPFRGERRDAGLSIGGAWGYGASQIAGATMVTARQAENLSAVLGAVGLISSAIAALPARVASGPDRQPAEGDPVSRLIELGPNDRDSWADFIEFAVGSHLLAGNAVVEITADGRGQVTGLRAVPWAWCSPVVLPGGALAFDVSYVMGPYGSTGRTRRLLPGEYIHLKDRSDDGYIGRSRLSRAGQVIATQLAADRTAAGIQTNGLRSSGLISGPKLQPDAIARFRSVFRAQMQGGEVAGDPVFMEPGWEFKPIQISPEDAELLNTRKFGVAEIARIFQIPVWLLGENEGGAAKTANEAARMFAQSCLFPLVTKIEQAFSRVIWPEGDRRLDLELGGYLRADPVAQSQALDLAVRDQILTIDEARAELGYGPRPDGLGNSVLQQPGQGPTVPGPAR